MTTPIPSEFEDQAAGADLPEAAPSPPAPTVEADKVAEIQSWMAEVFEPARPALGRRPLFGR
jgi:hypothetical protein